MRHLLLASASPARLATLRRAGVEPRVLVSGVDEEAALGTAAAKFGRLGSADEALVLARAKAQAVAESRRGNDAAIILGCDSILEFAGSSWGKPNTLQEARERWELMAGRSGILHTGHWIIDAVSGKEIGGSSATTVHFAKLSAKELERYLATREPLEVAGAFTIDGFGGWFIERIEGDHHGVVGVSLPLVRNLLAEIGLSITDFWH